MKNKLRRYWKTVWGKKKFDTQLSVVFIGAMGSLAFFASMINSLTVAQAMQDYMKDQGIRIVESLGKQSALALLSHSADNARDVITATLAFPGVLGVEIRDGNHTILVSKINSNTAVHTTVFGEKKPILSTLSVNQQDNLFAISHKVAQDVMNGLLVNQTNEAWYFGAPVIFGKKEDSPYEMEEQKPRTIGYVYVALGKKELDHLVYTLRWINVVMTLAFSIVLMCVLKLIAKKIMAPLIELAALMKRAERGESGIRSELKGAEDVVAMASAFNTMMEGLEVREAELTRSRDEAMQLARIKSQFATTVSHELRTPLNGVIGTLDMLKTLISTSAQQEYVDIAWRSSHSLLELINNILDFSKMESGRLELEQLPFNLYTLIEEVIELFAKQAQEKRLDVGYLIPQDFPRYLNGDALRLRQILINLVGNAIKFTEEGEVALRVTYEKITPQQLSVQFNISDTGIGMDAQAVERIFESFTQADNSTTRKYGGTGLGLAISKQLARLMGGDIVVQSRPNEGTTFSLTILLQPSEQSEEMLEEEQARKQEREGWSGTVCIVEPSPIVRDFFQQSLSECALTCHSLVSIAEVEKLYDVLQNKGQILDVLIIDKKIAHTEVGKAFLKSLRNQRQDASKPLLVALDPKARLASIPPYGFDHALAKPIRHHHLLSMMHSLMGNKASELATDDQKKPLSALKKDAVVEGTVVEPIWSNLSILIADDNKTNRLVAGRMVEMLGCKVTFAENGQYALDAAQAQVFDLILMDCSMPVMDGYEATRHIRELEKLKNTHIPIIALTANTQPGDQELCKGAGMDDYLPKPVTIGTLKAKLMDWLTRNSVSFPAFPLDASFSDGNETYFIDGKSLDNKLFEALLKEFGGVLEQSISDFLQTMEDSVGQLEEAVQQGELKTSSLEWIESAQCRRKNLSAYILYKVIGSFKDAPPQNIEQLIIQLRRAFAEFSSTIR